MKTCITLFPIILIGMTIATITLNSDDFFPYKISQRITECTYDSVTEIDTIYDENYEVYFCPIDFSIKKRNIYKYITDIEITAEEIQGYKLTTICNKYLSCMRGPYTYIDSLKCIEYIKAKEWRDQYKQAEKEKKSKLRKLNRKKCK